MNKLPWQGLQRFFDQLALIQPAKEIPSFTELKVKHNLVQISSDPILIDFIYTTLFPG
jgi:hypothetical protein